MSNLAANLRTHTLTVVSEVEDSAPAQWEVDPRTGYWHCRVPLTWTGVREYPQIKIHGRAARVLHRPEQAFAPGFLETVKRLHCTHDHPMVKGVQIKLNKDNCDLYQVGHTGDSIERIERNGYPVPVAMATITADSACRAIARGDTQTSLGYTAMLATPPEGELQEDGSGIWQGPHGPEAYDLEHVLDPEDPRVIAYAQAEPSFNPSDLGGNHLAVAIPRGRGGQLSELLTIVDSCDSCSGPVRVVWDLAQVQAQENSMADDNKNTPAASPTPRARVEIPALRRKDGALMTPAFVADMDSEHAAKIREHLAMAMEMLNTAMAEKEKAESEVLDMQKARDEAASMAASEKKAAEETAGKLEQAEQMKADMAEKLQMANDSLTAVTAERDSLLAEVKPLRAAALESAKQTAVKLGAPKEIVDACDSIEKVQAEWAKVRSPKAAERGAAAIVGAWLYAVDSLPTETPSETPTTVTDAETPAPTEPSPTFARSGNPTTTNVNDSASSNPIARSLALINLGKSESK